MNDTVQMLNLSELHPFPDHPFQVVVNAELREIAESVRNCGIISPLVVCPRKEGGYEIISGHRRAKAAEIAGLTAVPAFVREMDRDSAIITLVDSNMHREHILPSEKAFAYKMKLEAVKHQGERNDLTCAQTGHKSREAVGADGGDSGTQVQRYIRLTELIPPILKLVDAGKIALAPAVKLSYLSKEEQDDLLSEMETEARTPSLSQAQRMKELSAGGKLDWDAMFSILIEDKPNQQEQLKLKTENIRNFFPKGYTPRQMEEQIMTLLAEWQQKRERAARNRDAR